jgi:hypothetical protein
VHQVGFYYTDVEIHGQQNKKKGGNAYVFPWQQWLRERTTVKLCTLFGTTRQRRASDGGSKRSDI